MVWIAILMHSFLPRSSLRTGKINSAVRFLKSARGQRSRLLSTAEQKAVHASSSRNITHVERLDALLRWNASDFVADERARRVIVLKDTLQGMELEAEGAAEELKALVDAEGGEELLLGGGRDLEVYCGAMLRYVLHTFSTRGSVPPDFVRELLAQSKELMRSLPNVMQVQRARSSNGSEALGSITVVGDVHGQFHDFAQIFEQGVAGLPHAHNQFVFNGDLVDRGEMSCEIVLTLLLAKVLSSAVASAGCHEHSMSGAVHVLRGNHETTAMNENYGFAKEALQKFDQSTLDQFRAVFEALPVAAVLEDAVFVVHGGLGPLTEEMSIAQLNQIRRFKEPDHRGALTELLWSDPKDGLQGFAPNRRGIAHYFGANVTASFLRRNKLSLLIRSHEVFMPGFKLFHGGLLLSVFSAPNYCGQVGNLGAVVRFDKADSMNPVIRQFEAVEAHVHVD